MGVEVVDAPPASVQEQGRSQSSLGGSEKAHGERAVGRGQRDVSYVVQRDRVCSSDERGAHLLASLLDRQLIGLRRAHGAHHVKQRLGVGVELSSHRRASMPDDLHIRGARSGQCPSISEPGAGSRRSR